MVSKRRANRTARGKDMITREVNKPVKAIASRWCFDQKTAGKRGEMDG